MNILILHLLTCSMIQFLLRFLLSSQGTMISKRRTRRFQLSNSLLIKLKLKQDQLEMMLRTIYV